MQLTEQHKEALRKKKQYQKQQQKQYQKHEYHQETLPFNEHGSNEQAEKPLSESYVDQLFWNKLVQLGWRFNDQQRIDRLKSTQLMFVCPDCDKGLHSQQSHTITPARAKAMLDTHWLKRIVQKHKEDTTRGCHPEYDENGEAIAEAILKATPVFKKTATGKLRIDTIDGETKVFNGERWVPIN
jgi:hypothetical protein